MSEWLLLGAIVAGGVSGVPGLFLPRGRDGGQRLAVLLQCVASLLGMTAAIIALLFREHSGPSIARGLRAPLSIPGGEWVLEVDALSALFLLPAHFITGATALFGLEYWRHSERPAHGRRLTFFFGLLSAALPLLLVARNGICFLFGWEVMALSVFFLVSTEDERSEVRAAGWVYLASTHLSALLLFAFFGTLIASTGSFALDPIASGAVTPACANALFLLALGAFGLKAGLFPLHYWLPPAHANAPSHVSALLSGVVIKAGVYGLMRVLWMLPAPPLWWGELLLVLGAVSSVIGVAYALGQHDLKRLLAYHSIENIGIIFLGVGLGIAGLASARPDWMVLGFAGAMLHVWNHGLFKSLLFLAAGSVVHRVGTREIDRLGGLAHRMPWTSACFLLGAVAICGLPPLNGFVSELLVYLGLFRAASAGGSDAGTAALGSAMWAIPILALAGAMALACFVKVFGAAFLGTARSAPAAAAGESGAAIRMPMLALAGACLWIGTSPGSVAPLLDGVSAEWVHAGPLSPPPLERLTSLVSVSVAALSVLGAGLAAALWLARRAAASLRPAPERVTTWDCGYARPGASMQYTASSLAESLVRILSGILHPSVVRPRVTGHFPVRSSFHQLVPDLVLDRGILPGFDLLARACFRCRVLQRGRIHAYLLYIFLALLVLLLCA